MLLIFRLDVRTKLICVFLLTLLIFMINKLPAAVCLLTSIILIRMVLKIPIQSGKFLLNIALIGVFILLIQTLFGPGDTYIVKPLLNGIITIKREGFNLGLVIILRLFSLVLLLPVFIETTPRDKIAAGLCSLGINYRNSFIITITFNLISSFKDEAKRIMDAQKLRGFQYFKRKTVISWIKAYTGLLIPLILGAMRKAQKTSIAMDKRAFGIYKTRTWIDKPQMKPKDFFIIIACFIYFTTLILFNYWIF